MPASEVSAEAVRGALLRRYSEPPLFTTPLSALPAAPQSIGSSAECAVLLRGRAPAELPGERPLLEETVRALVPDSPAGNAESR